MANERNWSAYGPVLLVSDGDANGYVAVSDTFGLYVKQKVTIKSNTQPALSLQVKEVISNTIVRLGPPDLGLSSFSNLSNYKVLDGATLGASRQLMNVVKPEDIENITYAREPIVAKRVVSVDRYGNYYHTDNPMPVRLTDGAVNIGTVNAELEVQLSHKNDTPNAGDVADSVRVGDGINELKINGDGSLNIDKTGLATESTLSTRASETTVNAINNKLPASLGQKNSAGSLSVVVASDQTLPISIATAIKAENADKVYVSETYNTTSATFSDARPVNLSFNLRNYKSKTIVVKNTSVNNGRLTLLGSIDDGASYEVTLVDSIGVNAGIINVTTTDVPVTHVQVLVRSQIAAQLTTWVSKAYAFGV